MRTLHRLFIVALVFTAMSRAAAQGDSVRVNLGDRAPRPAGPRTLVGIVVDTTSVALDSIDVYIASLKKRTISDANGRFRFDDVKPGTYDVTARRIGYYPQVHKVKIDDNGGTAVFALVPVARVLAPVVTVSARGGLSGVIGDTSYRALPGAEISVLASQYHTTADSLGGFYLPLKPGKYMVRVKLEGYMPRLTSVSIPPDSGRRLMVWLAPPNPRESPERAIFNSMALHERMLWRKPSSSVFTREDILNSSSTELMDFVNRGRWESKVNDNCPAIIDGGPQTMAIWELHPAEIETIELYPGNSLPNLARAPRANAATRQRTGTPPRGDCEVAVYVWLRK